MEVGNDGPGIYVAEEGVAVRDQRRGEGRLRVRVVVECRRGGGAGGGGHRRGSGGEDLGSRDLIEAGWDGWGRGEDSEEGVGEEDRGGGQDNR